MATNPYTYGNLNERWVVGTPTSKAELDKARIRTDANRWTLSQLLADPDDDSSFDLTATSLSLTGALSAGSFSGSITSSNATITGGSITGITDLAIADGGTGASTASAARTNLGLVIGTDVQAYDPELQALSGLTPTDSHFIVGDGTTFVTEDAATARSSLGLRSMAEQNSAFVAITGGTITGLTNFSTSFATITGGSVTGITDITIADGGTGASNAADARTNLGLAIGTDVQAYDPELQALSGLTPTDGNFIVGNGTTFVTESASTARTSLGLGSIATQASNSVSISGGSISGITDLAVADGGTGASSASGARTNLGLGSLATASTINNGNWSGTDLAVANGGTGASNAADARTNLGLGSLATQSSINNSHWFGTDLAIANGGTGASDAATARTNLGLGSLATASTINNGNWSGTDLAIANGGTGASDAATARTNLGLGTAATYAVTNFPARSGYGNSSYYTVDNWIEYLGTTAGLYWSSGGGAGWHVAPSNQADFFFRSGYSGVSRIQFRDSGNTTRGVIAGNSGSGYDSISIESSSNSKFAEFRTSGYTYLYNRTRNEIAAGSDYVASFQNTTSATPYGVIIKDAASPTANYPLLTVTDSSGSTAHFRVQSSTGHVGVGTPTPQYEFVVSDGSGGKGFEFNVANGTNGGINTLTYNRSTSSYVTANHYAYDHRWYYGSGSVEGMRLTASRELFIYSGSNSALNIYASSSPAINWFEGTTVKAYAQWNNAGYFDLYNHENGGRLLIGYVGYQNCIYGSNDNKLLLRNSTNPRIQFDEGATGRANITWDAGNNAFRLQNQEMGDTAYIGYAGYQLALEGTRDAKIALRGATNPYIRFMEGTTEKGYLQWNSAGYFRLYNQEDTITVDWGDGYDQKLNSTNDGKLVLQGSTNPYIRFRESSTDKAFIQWHSNGYLTLYNQEVGKAIYVGGVPSSSFALQVNGYVDMGGNWIYQGVGAGIYSPSGHYLYSESGGGWFVRSGVTGASGIKLQQSGGGLLGWLYANTAGQGFLSTADSNWNFRVLTTATGHAFLRGSMAISSSSTPSYNLDVTGTIRATSDVISDSDVRHKSNIQDIHSAMDIVSGMRGVWYDKDGKQSVGVIAQEIEEVLPAVVHTADDEDGTKSVSYGNIVGVLIEAIKEQQQEIDALKARLN